jgi:hypothetical protein
MQHGWMIRHMQEFMYVLVASRKSLAFILNQEGKPVSKNQELCLEFVYIGSLMYVKSEETI